MLSNLTSVKDLARSAMRRDHVTKDSRGGSAKLVGGGAMGDRPAVAAARKVEGRETGRFS